MIDEPEPKQKSKTKSPLLEYVFIRYSFSFIGFCVGCILSISGLNLIILLGNLCPDSFDDCLIFAL